MNHKQVWQQAGPTTNWEQSPRELFGRVDDDEWFWLNTEGYRELPDLRRVLPGLPDEQLQSQTIGSSGDKALSEAFLAYTLFKQLYESHVGPIGKCQRILDFGCGWGRILRFFLKDLDAQKLWGIDPSEERIQACQATNRWCQFQKSSLFPPSDLHGESCDLIYGYSVFSHLAERTQQLWLTEFHRLLRPGGLLVMTTWHREFIEQCQQVRNDSDFPCEPNWRKELVTKFLDQQKCLADYDSGRFCFDEYDRVRSAWAFVNGEPFYGEACVPRGYVLDRWTDRFEFVDFITDRKLCPQNVIVVRKRRAP